MPAWVFFRRKHECLEIRVQCACFLVVRTQRWCIARPEWAIKSVLSTPCSAKKSCTKRLFWKNLSIFSKGTGLVAFGCNCAIFGKFQHQVFLKNDHAVTEQTLHRHSFQGQIPLLAVLEQQAARPWDDVEGACSAVSTALGVSQTLWKARRARSRRLEVKISQEVDSWLWEDFWMPVRNWLWSKVSGNRSW